METVMEWMWPTVAYGFIGGMVVWFGPRAFTLLRAVTSGWNKDNVASRLAICEVCPRVKLRHHVDDTGKEAKYMYCDECKCGSHHIAELNVKLGFNNLTCPMDKWGPKEAMTVHEGHDLLVERGRKEREVDQRERQNIMAGRPRDFIEPNIVPTNGPVTTPQPSRAANAPQLTEEELAAQRQRIAKARADAAQRALTNEDPNAARAQQQVSRGKVWGDQTKETEAAPVEADHEGQILVDQKE